MEQTTQRERGGEKGSPAAAGEANERRARYEAGLGVVGGGTMGLLLTIGFEILPASTLTEKMLIIVASLALGLASWIGFGAWHSIRRFVVVAVAAATAIVCMGALAIVANSSGDANDHTSASRSGVPVRSSANPPAAATHGAPSNASSSSSHDAAIRGPRIYLADMTADPSNYDSPQPNTWKMVGMTYPHSLGYPGGFCSSDEISYSLGGHYQRFQATVGLNYDADLQDQDTASNDGANFTVKADTGGGGMKEVFSGHAFWDRPIKVDVPVAGATMLQLTTDACLNSSNSFAVWGSPSLLP